MRLVEILVKRDRESTFHYAMELGVMPAIRRMGEGDTYLFPSDYAGAVKTAISFLRKDGYPVRARAVIYKNRQYMEVTRKEEA